MEPAEEMPGINKLSNKAAVLTIALFQLILAVVLNHPIPHKQAVLAVISIK
jgi:hypothetical protein